MLFAETQLDQKVITKDAVVPMRGDAVRQKKCVCGFESSCTSISCETELENVTMDNERSDRAHHFEGIEFLLDLLCKHRREAVARCNVSTTVVIRCGMGVVELKSRTEANVPRRSIGCSW